MVGRDKDPLRRQLLELKDLIVMSVLPGSLEGLGHEPCATPAHFEIMAIAVPPGVDEEKLGWQLLHTDAESIEPYSILCAVTPEYYFDMQLENEDGDLMRVRQKLDTGEMSIFRGNLPHAGGPTQAYRLHMTVQFSDNAVSNILLFFFILLVLI